MKHVSRVQRQMGFQNQQCFLRFICWHAACHYVTMYTSTKTKWDNSSNIWHAKNYPIALNTQTRSNHCPTRAIASSTGLILSQCKCTTTLEQNNLFFHLSRDMMLHFLVLDPSGHSSISIPQFPCLKRNGTIKYNNCVRLPIDAGKLQFSRDQFVRKV